MLGRYSDRWYSHGLDRELVNKQYKLCGILNGIDQKIYDPATDPVIAKNYSLNDKTGKAVCKHALLSELGMAHGKEPVIGIVTRFVSHKGLDLIKYVFEGHHQAWLQVCYYLVRERRYTRTFAAKCIIVILTEWV